LGSIVRQERIDALPSRHGLVSLAHLVERRAEREYRAGVDRVRGERPELRFLLTGPWPPYSHWWRRDPYFGGQGEVGRLESIQETLTRFERRIAAQEPRTE